MDIFSELFAFFWSLLDLSVTVGGYTFSVYGSIVFATIVLLFMWFVHWLFSN